MSGTIASLAPDLDGLVPDGWADGALAAGEVAALRIDHSPTSRSGAVQPRPSPST
jgi:hypothetical protein